MTSSSADEHNPSKKARRDAAREKARADREREQKRRRRNKIFVQGGVMLGLVAVLSAVTLIIVTSTQSSPGPANMISDGIVLSGDTLAPTSTPALTAGEQPTANEATVDPVSIVVYVDYLCPYCNQFESVNGALVEKLVTSGVATLEIHPIAILDDASLGSKYSTRAATAMACVANYQPDHFYLAHMALFANQPAEGTRGLSNDDIISVISSTGATDENIAGCIEDGTFTGWVADATKRVLNGGIPASDLTEFPGTPTVVVSGVAYTGHPADADAFEKFVTGRITTPVPTD